MTDRVREIERILSLLQNAYVGVHQQKPYKIYG